MLAESFARPGGMEVGAWDVETSSSGEPRSTPRDHQRLVVAPDCVAAMRDEQIEHAIENYR